MTTRAKYRQRARSKGDQTERARLNLKVKLARLIETGETDAYGVPFKATPLGYTTIEPRVSRAMGKRKHAKAPRVHLRPRNLNRYLVRPVPAPPDYAQWWQSQRIELWSQYCDLDLTREVYRQGDDV